MMTLVQGLSRGGWIRLTIAYLIAVWNAAAWLAMTLSDGPEPLDPRLASFFLLSVVLAPIIWMVWMIVVVLFDRARALLSLPSALLSLSPLVVTVAGAALMMLLGPQPG